MKNFNSKKLNIYLFFLLLTQLLLLSPKIHADLIIKRLETQSTDNIIFTSASADLKLSPNVIEAINNGIDIYINYEVRLRYKRAFRKDAIVKSWTNPYNIKFHSLSNQYIVSSPVIERSSHHISIPDALNEISELLNLEIDRALINEYSQYDYYLENRIVLDKNQLPNLLKVYANISPSWSLHSEWQSWPVQISILE